jgi:hypothetical protein
MLGKKFINIDAYFTKTKIKTNLYNYFEEYHLGEYTC